ncbi:MAG: phosphoenolpyruvate carboxykinase (GTP) [Parachlamydiales bacterium]|jgi:phosphoenolpyruvate carboxykinase (GTP)
MLQNIDISKWTKNKKVISWVEDKIKLCKPDSVHFCDGSKEEIDSLLKLLISQNKVIPLNPKKKPNSYLFRSTVDDVARVEERTFICCKNEEDAGPTNNWKDPVEMKNTMKDLFSGCMHGRVMYVIPFCMGPLSSDKSHIGIEITDSAYVVLNMNIMTRMGKKVMEYLDKDIDFVPCIHSVGKPLKKNEKDDLWPCNPENKYIVHFPEEKSIWSFGSGYGGNALLGKKCFALRIASNMAKEQSWLAEHMLILGITNPQGEKKYIAAAFPSSCGKTNLAMLQPKLKGWKVECIGDDIAWMKFGEDGKLYAINPEAGFFGVAPGTSYQTNYNAMKSLEQNSLFTNVALTEEGDVWWEKMTDKIPDGLIDWQGNLYDPKSNKPAAHANSRFTAPISQCPVRDLDFENPKGVPISAIIFGGRREDVVPLVYESFDWNHGVFLGASVSSQTTAAAKGEIGKLRHDPFAMLPFCGYNMADYFNHWLNLQNKTQSSKLPKIFYVNWFKKNENNEFIWPGFSDNIRVLKWIFERVSNKVSAKKTAIGYIPRIEDLDLTNLDISKENLSKLFEINQNLWLQEADKLQTYFSVFKDKLPNEMVNQIKSLRDRLTKETKCAQ